MVRYNNPSTDPFLKKALLFDVLDQYSNLWGRGMEEGMRFKQLLTK